MTSDDFLAALQARGVDSGDIRHAIHEAAHALIERLGPPWTNDRVHEALAGKRVGDALLHEVQARATEGAALRELGQGVWIDLVTQHIDSEETQQRVQQIFALVEENRHDTQ